MTADENFEAFQEQRSASDLVSWYGYLDLLLCRLADQF
jgi:hypothetical protein